MKLVSRPFIKGRTCYRCGADKKDLYRKGYYVGCESWGVSYGNHMWRGEEI